MNSFWVSGYSFKIKFAWLSYIVCVNIVKCDCAYYRAYIIYIVVCLECVCTVYCVLCTVQGRNHASKVGGWDPDRVKPESRARRA